LIQAQLEHAVESVNAGISPAQVADAVIDAIRNNRFYILTHPKFTGAVAIRMRDILEGRNPTNLLVRSVKHPED
jgi:hypothetical protein